MKLFISADMEGATGCINSEYTVPGKRHYEFGRELLTGDVNAVVEGALEAGATEILVNEAHWTMTNIRTDLLHPKVRYISGMTKKNIMMTGLDGTFDAAILVGCHARAGVGRGVMSHTFLGREIHNIRINGEETGEIGFNTFLAGYFGVPVLMVVGDLHATLEAEKLIPHVKTVATKEGVDRFAAHCLPHEESREGIREGARESLTSRAKAKPILAKTPVRLEIEFTGATMANVATLIPGVGLADDRTITYQSDDFQEVYNLAIAALFMVLNPMVTDALY